jgi:cell division protein FtsX
MTILLIATVAICAGLFIGFCLFLRNIDKARNI